MSNIGDTTPRLPGGDDGGIPSEREDWDEIMLVLTDLRAVIADAPEEGGGPNWDKENVLNTLDHATREHNH
ncbi:hypothetical protein [Streptomyces sp. 147326]|uniref:hypothetical protein n=1 Tax=Streptomyces sp. 147326 TaxID=3074379 RepID=UPI003857DCEF